MIEKYSIITGSYNFLKKVIFFKKNVDIPKKKSYIVIMDGKETTQERGDETMKKLTKTTNENKAETLKKMDALTEDDYIAAAAKLEGQEAYKTGSEKQVAYALDILADASIPCTCEPGKPYTFPAWHLYLTPAQIAIAKATMTAKEIIDGLSLNAVQKATLKALEA